MSSSPWWPRSRASPRAAGHWKRRQEQGPLLGASEVWRGLPQMCRQEELHLIGKLGSREVVAAVSSGPKGRIALLVDEASQQWFLVDTGSSYSIIPHKSKKPQSGLRLCTADRSPIACWGTRKMHVAAGGRRFMWDFLLVDVALAIIGADFLRHLALSTASSTWMTC